jgi:hypothetical protein
MGARPSVWSRLPSLLPSYKSSPLHPAKALEFCINSGVFVFGGKLSHEQVTYFVRQFSTLLSTPAVNGWP